MQSFSVLANNPHSKEKVTELRKVWLQAKCSSRISSLFWKTEDIKSVPLGTSLVAQKLRLRASNARGAGLTLGQETKIPHAALYEQEKTNKKNPTAT